MSLAEQDQQARQQIATALDQCLMVEAAAGTGKTTSIVTRMLNLVTEGRCDASHLAAVTFTRKAAGELRQRFANTLRQRLEQLQKLSEDLSEVEHRQLERLEAANQAVGQMCIETIHSFCARLIRERPIEFGVDPAFGELDASTEEAIRRSAWDQNLAELKSASDPLIGQLAEVGLRNGQLWQCFSDFLNFRDVSQWPLFSVNAPNNQRPPAQWHPQDTPYQEVDQYLEHIRSVIASFIPGKRDELMSRYELINRFSLRLDSSPRIFFALLEQFERSPGITQKLWPTRDMAKAEQARFQQFREDVVDAALMRWRQYRYQFVVRFVRRAVACYQQLKAASSGLDFTDLLLITAEGLRTQPHLREYFRTRFSHLLVDEFQDTDPIQAEILVLLSSDDSHETKWQACRLRPGSLFIVGDPKQSIYRFRRGDILTYKHTKSIFLNSGGQILSLSSNFRSSPELLEWNNRTFENLFHIGPGDEDTVAPHSPMFAGHVRTQCGTLSGVFKLEVPAKTESAIEWEAEQVARCVRTAIDQKLTIEVETNAEPESWTVRPVKPSDFLILMRNKKHIPLFKHALEQYGLECDVAGSNALSALAELRVLQLATQAIDDPYNPIPYLALLRDQLFGFSDSELYELKRLGGKFQFTAPLPTGLDDAQRQRLLDANQLLQQGQLWLRILPPATALTRIASALGILSSAAADNNGNLTLGTLLKSIELIRHRSWQFDCAADVISALDELLEQDEIEGITALPPADDAVRLMNLHKAKGLEAPIVFLVDGTRRSDFEPKHYIARDQDQPLGYMWITEKQNFQTRALAEPGGWQELQALEKRFQDAEENRLLYVATTRAANMLVVTSSSQNSCWSGLKAYLDHAEDVTSLIDSTVAQPSTTIDTTSQTSSVAVTQVESESIGQRWRQAAQVTYQQLNIKKESLRGRPKPLWQPSIDDGPNWGNAIHQLLDMAVRFPNFDLDRQAIASAMDNELDAKRVDELATSVRAVMASSIWQRAQAAQRIYSEIPIDVPGHSQGLPTITRGVIDLVFEESDGWVIVDYKSDQVALAEAQSALNYYRGQLEAYARHWQQLTGAHVKELGIYLTRLDLYLAVAQASSL